MNTSTWITLITAGLAVPVIGLQYTQNSRLRAELAQAAEGQGTEGVISGVRQGALFNEAAGEGSGDASAGAEASGSPVSGFGHLEGFKEILSQRDPLDRVHALLAFVGSIPPGERSIKGA